MVLSVSSSSHCFGVLRSFSAYWVLEGAAFTLSLNNLGWKRTQDLLGWRRFEDFGSVLSDATFSWRFVSVFCCIYFEEVITPGLWKWTTMDLENVLKKATGFHSLVWCSWWRGLFQDDSIGAILFVSSAWLCLFVRIDNDILGLLVRRHCGVSVLSGYFHEWFLPLR